MSVYCFVGRCDFGLVELGQVCREVRERPGPQLQPISLAAGIISFYVHTCSSAEFELPSKGALTTR